MANSKQVLVAVVLVVAVGGIAAKHFYIDNPPARVAKAYAETFPVHSADSAASDVTIYADPKDPNKSLILATDRMKGIAVYDLKGSEIDFDAIGKVTDIDLRTNVKLGNREITLVAAATGDKRELRLFELGSEKPYLRAIDDFVFDHPDVQADDICLYRDPKSGEASVYLIGRERDKVAEAKANLKQLAKLTALSKGAAESDPKKDAKKDEKKAKEIVPAASDAASPATTESESATAKTEKHAKDASSTAKADKSDKAEKKEKHAKKDKKETAKEKKAKETAPVKLTPEQESLTKAASGKEKPARGFYAVQMKIGVNADQALELTETRRIKLDGKCEGSAVDDEKGVFFVSEAKKGIWKFLADGTKDTVDVGTLICKVGFPNPLRPDVEGIALYRGQNGQGYLIAASEGSKDFVVLKRDAPYDYVGRFKVEGNGTVDPVDDSGGLAIASGNFGGSLDSGMLVFQDEKNENATGTIENQNFKIVPWSEVVRSLGF